MKVGAGHETVTGKALFHGIFPRPGSAFIFPSYSRALVYTTHFGTTLGLEGVPKYTLFQEESPRRRGKLVGRLEEKRVY